jgi:restriction system protein
MPGRVPFDAAVLLLGSREAGVVPRASLADKAEEVLRRHSKGAPMHYRRLTELGIAEGLIVPGGLTPEASLNSAVTQDIKKRQAAGEPARFLSHGRGYFSLARPSDPLHGAVERKNREVRDRLREVLGEMHPQAFERLIGELLVAIGFDGVEVTRYVGDKGIDLRATLVVGGVTDVRTAIQVKRHTTGSIGAPTVRELRGGLGPHDRGLIITLSRFSKDAQREASEPDRSPISLVDGSELIELLVDHRVGVTSTTMTVLELDEGYFIESAEDDEVEPVSGDDISIRVRRRRSTVPPGKVLTLWPLPGGASAWKDTLDVMLKHVAAEAPTMADAIGWLIISFDRVASHKTARGYWQVLRSLGLIETRGEQVAVTALGTDYLDDPTNQRLLDIACEQVVGVEEMLLWLDERPHTMNELLTRLRDDLGVDWQSTAQVQYRLGWLNVLEAATAVDGVWQARQANTTPERVHD